MFPAQLYQKDERAMPVYFKSANFLLLPSPLPPAVL